MSQIVSLVDDDAMTSNLELLLEEPNRLYQGTRVSTRQPTIVVTVNGEPLRHVVRHSHDGFEWGYNGSGPADLARSLLTDAVGPAWADRNYQQYKFAVVGKLPHGGWILSRRSIIQWLIEHGRTPLTEEEES